VAAANWKAYGYKTISGFRKCAQKLKPKSRKDYPCDWAGGNVNRGSNPWQALNQAE
jgi:hypothetical protein